MSGLSTHVLDTASGKPAAGISVGVYRGELLLNSQVTNTDGRIPMLLGPDLLTPGIYKLVFAVADYFPHSFFPEVIVVFEVADQSAHYHVPLLLSPFGYSTYRGS